MSLYFAAAGVEEWGGGPPPPGPPLLRSVLSVTGHRHPDLSAVALSALPTRSATPKLPAVECGTDRTVRSPPPGPASPTQHEMHASVTSHSFAEVSCRTEPTAAASLLLRATLSQPSPHHCSDETHSPSAGTPSGGHVTQQPTEATIGSLDATAEPEAPVSVGRLPSLMSSTTVSKRVSLPDAMDPTSRGKLPGRRAYSIAVSVADSCGGGAITPSRGPSMFARYQHSSFFSDDGSDSAASPMIRALMQRNPSLPAFQPDGHGSPEHQAVIGLAQHGGLPPAHPAHRGHPYPAVPRALAAAAMNPPRAPVGLPEIAGPAATQQSTPLSPPTNRSAAPGDYSPAAAAVQDAAMRAAFVKKVIKRAPKARRQ